MRLSHSRFVSGSVLRGSSTLPNTIRNTKPGDPPIMPSTTFAALGVSAALVRTLHARGLADAFDTQTMTVPDGLAGRDLCGRAPTGSGKTIAFGIPLAARVARARARGPRGLVLVPARELAPQVCGEREWLGRARNLRVGAVCGGAGVC